MVYSFFDELMVWNKKSGETGNAALLMSDYDPEDLSELKKMYNGLARICGIGPGAKFSIGGFSNRKEIHVKNDDCEAIISRHEMTIVHKDYKIHFDNDMFTMSFQIANNEGFYRFNPDDSVLSFYDKEALEYATQYKENEKSEKSIAEIFSDLGIKCDEVIRARADGKKYERFETLRLFQLIKNNKSLGEIEEMLEADRNYCSLEEIAISRDKSHAPFSYNSEYKTRAHIIKGEDSDNLQEMVVELTLKNNSLLPESYPKIFLKIYSFKDLGSMILASTYVPEGAKRHFVYEHFNEYKTRDSGIEFDEAYQTVLENIADLKFDSWYHPFGWPSPGVSRNGLSDPKLHKTRGHTVFTPKTIQNGEIVEVLSKLLPDGSIFTIPEEKEEVPRYALNCEIRTINERNRARSIADNSLREAMLAFKKQIEQMKKNEKAPIEVSEKVEETISTHTR